MASRQIYWLAPTTVAVAFSAGVLFALGHHLFYSNLNGRFVSDDQYNVLGTQISRQSINLTAGIAFSYLVNFSLATAVATAYVQVFWRDMLHRKVTLDNLNIASSGLTNAFSFLKVRVWWDHRLLCGLAIVAWLLPLAPPITPGTLSVVLRPVEHKVSVSHVVPNVDFVSLNYVDNMPHQTSDESSADNTRFNYAGPSKAVQRVVNEVSATGSLLHIKGPFTNASWNLDFSGPGLRCTDVPQTVRSLVQQDVISATLNSSVGCTTHGYYAWTNTKSAIGLSSNTASAFSSLVDGSIALNVVAMPHMMQVDPTAGPHSGGVVIPYLHACLQGQQGGLTSQEGREERFANATMMQCQLLNTTYRTLFEYINGEQHVSATTETTDDSAIHPVHFVRGYGQAYPKDVINGVDCTVLTGTTFDGSCSIDIKMLRTLSYQAIFDAFSSLVSGTVSRQDAASSPTVKTSVEDTVLVDTPELQFLNESRARAGVEFDSLQQYISGSGIELFDGLINNAPTPQVGSLPRTIERLFQQVTLSMMSESVLQPNQTSPYAPPPVGVILHNWHNIYIYSASKLWLAYGLAILFTLIVVGVGVYSLIANRASYSDDFSTIFRVSRGATMTLKGKEEERAEDADGRDPLPKYLAEAKVWVAPMGMRVDTRDLLGISRAEDGKKKEGQQVGKEDGRSGGGEGGSTSADTSPSTQHEPKRRKTGASL